jgi:hypothetical protein
MNDPLLFPYELTHEVLKHYLGAQTRQLLQLRLVSRDWRARADAFLGSPLSTSLLFWVRLWRDKLAFALAAGDRATLQEVLMRKSAPWHQGFYMNILPLLRWATLVPTANVPRDAPSTCTLEALVALRSLGAYRFLGDHELDVHDLLCEPAAYGGYQLLQRVARVCDCFLAAAELAPADALLLLAAPANRPLHRDWTQSRALAFRHHGGYALAIETTTTTTPNPSRITDALTLYVLRVAAGLRPAYVVHRGLPVVEEWAKQVCVPMAAAVDVAAHSVVCLDSAATRTPFAQEARRAGVLDWVLGDHAVCGERPPPGTEPFTL